MPSYYFEQAEEMIHHLNGLKSGTRLRIILRVLKNSPFSSVALGIGTHVIPHIDLTSMGLAMHAQCKEDARLWFEGNYGGMLLSPFDEQPKLSITAVGMVVSDTEPYALITGE